jgi:NAD(P)H dehydrogenase (quinone)
MGWTARRHFCDSGVMQILLVYAHPEPRSFNGAMKELALSELGLLGHDVVVSDLYAMQFWAGAGWRDFKEPDEDHPLHLQTRQAEAARTGGFAPEVQAEIDRLLKCQALILQFPFWWFSVPGILKGWIDRVFAYGVTYGGGASLAGRRALVVTTTGGPHASYGEDGRGSVESHLKHLLVGTLAFCHMEVLPPFVAYGPGRLNEAGRAAILEQYRWHVRQLFASAKPKGAGETHEPN